VQHIPRQRDVHLENPPHGFLFRSGSQVFRAFGPDACDLGKFLGQRANPAFRFRAEFPCALREQFGVGIGDNRQLIPAEQGFAFQIIPEVRIIRRVQRFDGAVERQPLSHRPRGGEQQQREWQEQHSPAHQPLRQARPFARVHWKRVRGVLFIHGQQSANYSRSLY
jgi:hypothetical protein